MGRERTTLGRVSGLAGSLESVSPSAMIQQMISISSIRRCSASVVLPLMLMFGLLLAPVTCTCGASVPHGHSLFQLPHHHHGSDDHGHDHNHANEHHDHADHGHHDSGFAHLPHPLAVSEPECEDPKLTMLLAGNFVLSNALEHQDSAVLQAPPASSFGQPMTIAQPSVASIQTVDACESIDLPSTRTMQGLTTTPEPPPPKA